MRRGRGGAKGRLLVTDEKNGEKFGGVGNNDYLCSGLNKERTDMNTLTISDFKKNMSSSLNRIDAGERVYIRRGTQIYTVIPVRDNDDLSPDLYADIEAGRKEYAAGKCVECRNHEELSSFLESL